MFIKDFQHEKLAHLIDANQLSYDVYLARRSNSIKLQIDDKLTWIESNNSSPMFNGVLEAAITPSTCISDINKMIENLKSKQRAFCWKIWSSSTPSNLLEIITSQGLTLSAENPGMAADLNEFKFPQDALDGFTVKQVDSEQELHVWVNSVLTGFQISSELGEMYKTILTDSGFKFPIKNYLGRFNGKPVATACCFFFGGVVGIYWVATLAQYREKGIGRHMMSAILNDALIAGYRVAILQSSEKGFSMYQKLGFSECCKNVRYEWKI